ncbi:uncharacterized protein LOC129406785 [Sorex araneus]|uniref:uncharacterized protein LOC129406785 n=1 Tax=Sorex araneus TaxID=42254 RepID=UPI002433A236|nr:uncharacterized protein LOC129406785 [Sorex araneus]
MSRLCTAQLQGVQAVHCTTPGGPAMHYTTPECPSCALHNSRGPGCALHNSRVSRLCTAQLRGAWLCTAQLQGGGCALHNSRRPGCALHNSRRPGCALHNSRGLGCALHNSRGSGCALHNSRGLICEADADAASWSLSAAACPPHSSSLPTPRPPCPPQVGGPTPLSQRGLEGLGWERQRERRGKTGRVEVVRDGGSQGSSEGRQGRRLGSGLKRALDLGVQSLGFEAQLCRLLAVPTVGPSLRGEENGRPPPLAPGWEARVQPLEAQMWVEAWWGVLSGGVRWGGWRTGGRQGARGTCVLCSPAPRAAPEKAPHPPAWNPQE